MVKRLVFFVITVALTLHSCSLYCHADALQTQRYRYMEWGFSIELPVGWERQNNKVPDYSFYTCIEPLKENEIVPRAKINMIVGSKKEEHDDELFFEKTLMGVTGKEIDRGTLKFEKSKRKMTGKWIYYTQQRQEHEDVRVLANVIIEEESIVYIIICYADDTLYDEYEDTFKKVVSSLQSEKIKIGD